MVKTTTISVHIDSDLKKSAESILASLGFTPSQAINVFYKQITFQYGLPFSVTIPVRELNETTKNTMDEKELDTCENPLDIYSELDIKRMILNESQGSFNLHQKHPEKIFFRKD
ncbi:MAG: type II toxin-antitoxin system RelB/DinJ family antitoxin [Thermodesulfobacteriota bacterium]|nr:type II toxin-antitoxin system RelB/DinJ family antitoxin [Thermodesulfobacteriota bacterium]